MYLLKDDVFFFYAGKWDGKGNCWGHIRHPVENRLLFKIFHRSVLEIGELVPGGKEPWDWTKYPKFSINAG